MTKTKFENGDAVSHPDQVLQELQARTKDKPRVGSLGSKRNLELIHNACRKQYEAGSLDFSPSVIAKSLTELGTTFFVNKGLSRAPYRDLMRAWATFAGGHTRSLRALKSIDALETGAKYIDAYFRKIGCLPTFRMIFEEGVSTSVGEGQSQGARTVRVHACMKRWQEAQKECILDDVGSVCDALFEKTGSVPSLMLVRETRKNTAVNLSDTQLEDSIEHWRQYRFAMDLWKYAPTADTTRFRWLLLHPELCEWRPILLEFLETKIKERQRKATYLALHNFFYEYLFLQALRLTPKSFLSKGYKPPPIAEVCMKELAAGEVFNRWRSINVMLEYALDQNGAFALVDGQGYRVRKQEYENTFPPIAGSRFDTVRGANNKILIPLGALKDSELTFLTDINPQLEQWRIYGVGWLASMKANLGAGYNAVKQLVVDYIASLRLPADPSTLLSVEWQRQNEIPSYAGTALETLGSKHALPQFSKAIEFIDYVLITHYSAEDDFGRRTVSGDFRNFLLHQFGDLPRSGGTNGTQSNKDVLPTRYLKYMREMICPNGAEYFRDLKWAHDALPFGDWFEVHPDVIDKEDPDCVWRGRLVYGKNTRKQGLKHHVIYEIWSPVRAVGILIKLELPLRTLQVRMLDSGEADTWRFGGSKLEKNHRGEWIYRAGKFEKNKGPLVSDIGKTERHAGVFRRMPDANSGKVFAGLYINTNKTQDRGKERWDRGYVIPWQHGKVLYWCERLRKWQEKYNKLARLVPCMELSEKIFGKKTDLQKSQMGSMAFLLRDPAACKGESAWPIPEGKLAILWVRMLEKLEELCAETGQLSADGSPLRFISKNDDATTPVLYSLHSLRVSLITHLATDGGIEMSILSECIAGHARILMTLYYKKSGIVYVSEAMDAASERLEEETVEQKNWVRWMKDATLRQLEVNSASVDLSVLQTVQDALSQGGVSLLRTNLGLCAKGGMGCSDGGIYVDEDSQAVSYGPTPGYPQQKNCVRCRWFLTGPAFLQALVHHWNLLHYNLGDSGERYLQMSTDITELETEMLSCQKNGIRFKEQTRLESLRHQLAVIYDGNEKLAADSLATMRLIIRCKGIIDLASTHDDEVVLLSVGGMDEVTINVRECSELEQVLTVAVGSTIYVDEEANRAMLKAGNAFDRMLSMNGKEPVFFKLDDRELPLVVSHMTRLLRAYTGSIGNAIPFIEGIEQLSELGLIGDTEEILSLASAGTPIQLLGRKQERPIVFQRKENARLSTLPHETSAFGATDGS